VRHLASGGRAILVAVHGKPVQIDTVPMMLNQHEIRGSYGYLPAEFDEVIQAMSQGAYSFDGWVRQMKLDELVAAIQLLRDGKYMKILLSPR
jgi:(R,R)-butanediol dehydrogenase / meso-butanediol dehydrogenase / diacetyl reductase